MVKFYNKRTGIEVKLIASNNKYTTILWDTKLMVITTKNFRNNYKPVVEL